MKVLSLTIFMMFCLSILPSDTVAQRRHSSDAFLLIVDRGGMNVRPELNHNVIKQGLSFLVSLRRFGKFAKAHVEIIGMGEGKSLWVGTPRSLVADEERVLDAISMKSNMCADLQKGFHALQTKIKNIERRSFKSLHILIYSPLIHSGLPCNNVNITLPQIPPVNFDFAKAVNSSAKIKTILFFNVNPSQMEVWGVDGITKPLVAWADQGNEYNFHLFDEISSVLSYETEVRGIFR